MMAAVDYETLLLQTGTAMIKTVRTVPLPSAAVRTGPILCYPPNDHAAGVLRIVGTVVQCADEAQMKPLVSITGHISHFYEMMQVAQGWAVSNGTAVVCLSDCCDLFVNTLTIISGVDGAAARQFIAAFYSSMAQNAERSSESFGGICKISLFLRA